MASLMAQLHDYQKSFQFDMERNFDPAISTQFTNDNWAIPVTAVTLYLIMVFLGPRIMSSRKAFDLTYPLAFWNALLCIFSTMGMIRTVIFIICFFSTKPSVLYIKFYCFIC
jgi:uncharacterized membrane protein YhaH (DUF805 family)